MSLTGRLIDRLLGNLARMLTDPATYESRALRECSTYPEGDLFPFTQPMVGFACAAARDPGLAAEAARLSMQLADMAIRAVVRRVHPPQGRLESMPAYAGEGVYLGHLAMSLGAFRLMGGDARFESIRQHLVALLFEALLEADGKPLESFPGVSWPFDTIPPLVALRFDERIAGAPRCSKVIDAHLAWVRGPGTDPETRLPWSRVDDEDVREPPRGCDLSWRVPLMSLIDRAATLELYRHYCRTHWVERGILAGFAEYPHGRDLGADADSGPIVLGIGLAATGFGIAAADSAGDRWRLSRLLLQLPLARAVGAVGGARLRSVYAFDPAHVTGSLMGDACLFGMLGLRPPR